MPDIGRASLLIVPRFDNLTKSVNDALRKAGAQASASGQGVGERASSGFGRGLAKSGAVIGAFSAITNSAMSAISSHVGDAVSRFDTLNQYPRTMELLGYSSESAEASISKMSDRLSYLPTRLDDMVGTVQGIVAVTGDLDQATEAGLALNDMLVASGSSQQLVNAAMEQFRQMLAKGKPELEDWKSLTSAAPGQMQQLAEAMLGPTANANDLYYALGGGGQDPTLTMDDLLDAMVRLDNEGGDGITSFREQAETAAGGVQTAMANMGNAVTKGIASVMDEIGQDRISGVLNDLKGGINDAFGVARDVAGELVPVLSDVYDNVAPIAPQVVTMTAAFAALNAVGGRAYDALSGMSDGIVGLLSSITPAKAAIAGVSAVVTIAAAAWADYAKRQENLEAATRGLSDAVSETASLDEYSGAVDGVGKSAGAAAMSVDELAEATARRVETMRGNAEAAEAEIAQLSTAQGIINDYAGATDLSAEAQGRLEWALGLVNEQFGTSITQADVMAGKYTDQSGEVLDLRDSINQLIESKKAEARASAVTANLTEAYGAQSDAAKTLAQSQQDYNDKVQWYMDSMAKNGREVSRAQAEAWAATTREGQALESATEQYRSASDAVSDLEAELGNAAAASSEAATELDAWAAGTGPLFEQQLAVAGTSLSMLKDDLSQLGASTEDLSSLSEDQLAQLARTYDGTSSSIVGMLEGWGVSMDGAAASAARMSSDVAAAIERMGATEGLEAAGVDVDAFAQRLSAAGVETSALSEVGSANLASLAEACRGDMDAMVWAVQNYNSVPLIDKHGNVTLNDAQLRDAQGNVYTWNGSALVDQDGNVAVEDQSLIDAQGRVYTWNGTTLQSKSATATVSTNIGEAMSLAQAWNRTELRNKYASGTVNVYTNHIAQNMASGGVIAHADGGVIGHADGFIANRPGPGVPIHVVGEAGAEAVIPLTNRRYSQPFVDLVAEGVSDRLSGPADSHGDALMRRVVALLSEIRDAIPQGADRESWARDVRRAVRYEY